MPDSPLDALQSPHADDHAPRGASMEAMFWRPPRLGVDSAWYGHLPFGMWLVTAARPRMLVELGTHTGVSYCGFCEAVLRAHLDTRCIAIDTWRGDEHAGFYGEEVLDDLRRFHDARYGGISVLLRSTFDAALPTIPDGSVDLLHIDGRHTYEDVEHDFTSWRPKLSSRAVVLLHDVNVRERGFGVWKLWAELSPGVPHFEFFHEHGLGLLCVGAEPPMAVRDLCTLDPAAAARLREQFAMVGERWMLERVQRRQEQAIADSEAHVAELSRKFEELIAYTRTLQGGGPAPTRAELRGLQARTVAADLEIRRLAAELEGQRAARDQQIQRGDMLRAQLDALRAQLNGLHASRTWRLARRIAAGNEVLRGIPRARSTAAAADLPGPRAADPQPQAIMAEQAVPIAEHAVSEHPAAATKPRVLFGAGEPDTPGCIYRCQRMAVAAEAAGWDARWKFADTINPEDLRNTDLVILWRVTLTPHVKGVIEHVKMFGGRVGLDLDDLMVRIDLARVEYIDAIRSINWSENHVRGMFVSVTQALQAADFGTATTPELAHAMRAWQKAAYVLPNCFDNETLRRSRRARRAKGGPEADGGLVRLGYASGSRTHQRDFECAVAAVAAVLRARAQTRLVLFRRASDDQALLSIEEFPELAGLEDRIEWRDLVDLEDLPEELARFDINLVPLQVGNPFVEAKSELKFFEAAIAGVPTVASPTGPYRRAIIDGQTGFLAASPAQWEAALLRLVDQPALRERIARAAESDVVWQFGPQRQAELMRRFLAQQRGGEQPTDAQALGAAFSLGLQADQPRRMPAPLNEIETLFIHDTLGEAEVTVTIASYNYADYIQHALDSVRLQTLATLDLVVVDDASTDPDTATLILDWAHLHAHRFNRLQVVRHLRNGGLGATRNTGFSLAATPYVLPLDADNRLLPDCAQELLAVVRRTGAAFAYPRLQHFGSDEKISGGERWEPQRLVGGNYVDAMALLARWAWSAAGGYYVQADAMGWEDYSLWCSLAELGIAGQAVDAVLAEYRVHHDSMVNSITETQDNKRAVVELAERRHPWLRILRRDAYLRR